MASSFAKNLLLCFAGLLLLSPAPARAQNHELPDGPGKLPLQRICSACHAPEVVVGKHESKDGWEAIVSSMVEKGAVGTDEELNLIVDYLAANFPKTASGDKTPPASQPNPKN